MMGASRSGVALPAGHSRPCTASRTAASGQPLAPRPRGGHHDLRPNRQPSQPVAVGPPPPLRPLSRVASIDQATTRREQEPRTTAEVADHANRASTGRTMISGPSTRTFARFLCCNVRSTNAVTCGNVQASLPHENRAAVGRVVGPQFAGFGGGSACSLLAGQRAGEADARGSSEQLAALARGDSSGCGAWVGAVVGSGVPRLAAPQSPLQCSGCWLPAVALSHDH